MNHLRYLGFRLEFLTARGLLPAALQGCGCCAREVSVLFFRVHRLSRSSYVGVPLNVPILGIFDVVTPFGVLDLSPSVCLQLVFKCNFPFWAKLFLLVPEACQELCCSWPPLPWQCHPSLFDFFSVLSIPFPPFRPPFCPFSPFVNFCQLLAVSQAPCPEKCYPRPVGCPFSKSLFLRMLIRVRERKFWPVSCPTRCIESISFLACFLAAPVGQGNF